MHKGSESNTLSMKFQTDLYLAGEERNNLSNEFSVNLDYESLDKIKTGGNLDLNVMSFLILDFLLNGPAMKYKNNANNDFLIVTEICKEIRSNGKKYIILPFRTGIDCWSVGVLNIDENSHSLIYFDKIEDGEKCKNKLISVLGNSDFSIEGTEISMINISEWDKIQDTGLIIFKIVMDLIYERENMREFIKNTNFNEYCSSKSCKDSRDNLCKKYSDALVQLEPKFPLHMEEDNKSDQEEDEEFTDKFAPMLDENNFENECENSKKKENNERDKLDNTLNLQIGHNTEVMTNDNLILDESNLNNISEILNNTATNESFIKKGGIAQMTIDFSKPRSSVTPPKIKSQTNTANNSKPPSSNPSTNEIVTINTAKLNGSSSNNNFSSIANSIFKQYGGKYKNKQENSNVKTEVIEEISDAQKDDLENYKLYPEEEFSSKTYVRKRTSIGNPLNAKKNLDSFLSSQNNLNSTTNNNTQVSDLNKGNIIENEDLGGELEPFSSKTYVPPRKTNSKIQEIILKPNVSSKQPKDDSNAETKILSKPLKLNKKENKIENNKEEYHPSKSMLIPPVKGSSQTSRSRHITNKSEINLTKGSDISTDSYLTHHMKKEFNKRGPKIRASRKTNIEALIVNFPIESSKNEQTEESCASCNTGCFS